MDLTNNEIENINERHTKLRQEHEKLKGEVETQNKYNADNQVRISVMKWAKNLSTCFNGLCSLNELLQIY